MKPTAYGDLRYFARYGLVRAKQLAGISRTGDKTFFIERLSRLLKSGRVRDCKVMALGKNDGAGSQALTSISALAFAKVHGVTYVHRPFEMLEHEPSPEAVRAWEDYFNLGEGETSLSQCAGAVVPVEDYLARPDLWGRDVVVAAEHFLHYCNRDPSAWTVAAPHLQSKYRSYGPRLTAGRALVAVHMRRGDVSAAAKRTAKNFTPDDAFLSTVTRILRVLEKSGREPSVEIHSQGNPSDFEAFSRLGCRLRLDEPAMASHERLVNADVLVMSRSSFSYTAALLARGAVLYDPQKYKPMPHWITRGADGAFDEAELARQLGAGR